MAKTIPIGENKFVNVLYEIPEKWRSPEYSRFGSVVYKRLPDGKTQIVGHLEEVGQVGNLSEMAFPRGLPPTLAFGNLVVSALNLGLTAFTLVRMERNFQHLFKELELHRQLLIEIKALVTEVLEEMEMQHKANIQSALDLIRHAMNSREDSVAKGYLVEAKATLNKERQYLTMKSGKVAGNAFLVDLDILRMLYLTGLAEAQIEMRLGSYKNAVDVMEGTRQAIHAHTEAMLKPLIGPHPAWWVRWLSLEESKGLGAVGTFLENTRFVLRYSRGLGYYLGYIGAMLCQWWHGSHPIVEREKLIHRSQWRSHLNYLAGMWRDFEIETSSDSMKCVWKRMEQIMPDVFQFKGELRWWEISSSLRIILGTLEARDRFTGLKALIEEQQDLARFLLENGLKEEENKLVVLDLETSSA